MTLAILIVVVAQFFNAVAALIDKYIVSTRRISEPSYYAFLMSMLSAFSVFVFLFGFIPGPFPELSIPSIQNIEFPTITTLTFSLISGASFFFALWALFSALRKTDASDVIPVVGSISALFALPLGYYIFDTRLSPTFLVGILLLILGSFVLSHYRFKKGVLFMTVMSGIFFALHFISLKLLFEITSFDSAFFWSRIGIVVAALMLFIPKLSSCKTYYKNTTRGSHALIVGNKILAGVASFLILKAIDLSNVALVQALGGLQFVFLLIVSVTIGQFLPPEIGENQVGRYKIQKTIAVGMLVSGFLFLFL